MLSAYESAYVTKLTREILTCGSLADNVDDCAMFAGYRAYSGDSTDIDAPFAALALSEFFSTGSATRASSVLAKMSDPALSLEDAIKRLEDSSMLQSLIESTTREVCRRARVPRIRPLLEKITETTRRIVENHMCDRDTSDPLDMISDESVIVCYIPGYRNGMSFASTMTSYDGTESGPANILPNAAFERFLKLVNVSSDDYAAIVLAETGVRLVDVSPQWSQFAVSKDVERDQMITNDAIIDGIYGSPQGFSPMIAFSANPRHLIERDWSQPMTVTGGMVGFHDFVNGSGNPQRFEETISFTSSPFEFLVGESRRFGLDEVHGFGPKAFNAIVSYGPSIEERQHPRNSRSRR